MAPKFDPNAVTYVYLRQYGGEVGSSAVLAPQVGKLGLNAKKIGDDIAKQTAAWKGIKIQVELKVQNRQATVGVIPTSTALVLKALKEPPRDRKKVKEIKHSGNITMENVLEIAKTMRDSGKGIPSRELSGTVLEILGTCMAVGCQVDNEAPQDIQQRIQAGELEIEA
ncbi:MAG: uncharacterized protein KVP18_001687 [Porospora cf. gigantea A]|uniref:uncharacterized protein n=1 Tax=Porospora cf. gigantea A TaxID=2853593 RepID=UPI003559CFA0|nr:MAG: hypothetical protein KVP18_001687 [Porospora cf. gigantea A]